MARKDALLRLHRHLLARRDALRKSLKDEIEDLREYSNVVIGDSADAASDLAHHEVSSQIAELEARELAKIERALHQMRKGTYGVCEGCGKKIPMQRLNALPYTTYCVTCQRDEERGAGGSHGSDNRAWDKLYDVEQMESEDRVRLSDIELDLSNSGR